MFYLKGIYTIENINNLEDVLKNVECEIDYSQAEVDSYVKIILDSINQKIIINNFLPHSSLVSKISLKKILYKNFKYIYDLFLINKLIFRKPIKSHQVKYIMSDIANALYSMCIQAIPITIFLGMLLGISITMQASKQLKLFGCEIYSLDLLIFSFLKEMGLLVGIMVLSARSGAAMVSKIGFMKIADEWDSLIVMQINPHIFLLQSKVISFIISMVVLSYVACFAGIFGGYLVLLIIMNLHISFFLQAFIELVDYQSFLTILFKGPFFGWVIGLVCAFESIKIKLNSESIIKRISTGVVYSICFCVFLDFLFNFFVFGF